MSASFTLGKLFKNFSFLLKNVIRNSNLLFSSDTFWQKNSCFVYYPVHLIHFQASDYHLQFTEDHQEYDEKIHIDKAKGIVIYRVPQHSGLSAAHYLKDFKKV